MKRLKAWFKQEPSVIILLLIAAFTLTVRALAGVDLDHTALLYIACPFLIALALSFFTRNAANTRWWHGWWNTTRNALIVLFGSSIVLFEGWLCVALFLPIFLLFVLTGFLVAVMIKAVKRRGRGVFSAFVLPLAILVFALEGTAPAFTAERENRVSRSLLVAATPMEIHARLAQPQNLPAGSGLFISWFPMPHTIDVGDLKAGEVHNIHFRYKRWFVTNVHEGTLRLKILEVAPRRITTRFIADTSYLANYMTFHGTQVDLLPVGRNHTRVTLTAAYSRNLDPAWYFGPLQELAVGEALAHVLREFIDDKSIISAV